MNTKINTVIEALEKAAGILQQVNQHSAAHECDQAIALLRSLPEQGEPKGGEGDASKTRPSTHN